MFSEVPFCLRDPNSSGGSPDIHYQGDSVVEQSTVVLLHVRADTLRGRPAVTAAALQT